MAKKYLEKDHFIYIPYEFLNRVFNRVISYVFLILLIQNMQIRCNRFCQKENNQFTARFYN